MTNVPVLAFNPKHTTNAQRVKDLVKLGYLPAPILDPTFGRGGMWKECIHLCHPNMLITNDLDPDSPAQHHYDFTKLPPGWTNQFASALFDPPYRLGGTPSTKKFDDAYGLTRYRSKDEVYELYTRGLISMRRVVVPGGYVIVKCQDHVSSGKVQWQTEWVTEIVSRTGLTMTKVDELHLLSGRAQPAGTSQVHARRNYSTFVVLTNDKPTTSMED